MRITHCASCILVLLPTRTLGAFKCMVRIIAVLRLPLEADFVLSFQVSVIFHVASYYVASRRFRLGTEDS